MAPVVPTTTNRLKVHYSGPFGEHTMLFHGATGTTAEDLAGDVADFIDQAVALQYSDVVWDTAEYAAAGSNIFLPYAAWTPINGTTAITPNPLSAPSAFCQFGGRAFGSGVRVKLYLFEVWTAGRDNMRILAGEEAGVDAVIAELSSVDNQIAAIDGETPVWKTYANVGQNDHLTRKARS